MKPCSNCQDTSPDDARFCIGCGAVFAATGVTQRMTSAGVPTMELVDTSPSSEASAIPVSDFLVGTVYVPVAIGSAGAIFIHTNHNYQIGFGSTPTYLIVKAD